MSIRSPHHAGLKSLIQAALHSPGLLPPNDFNLARYSLNPQTRNLLLDPDVCALEDYLIDGWDIPNAQGDVGSALLHAFGDVVGDICNDDDTSLQTGYHHMGWLLAWLNSHHQTTFFAEEPDSPLQVLQMAAALGIGEWASAYNQIEEGLENLFKMANSPLWRVRDAGALGLQRMLMRSWERTIRRFRYQAMIANVREWRAMTASFGNAAEELLTGEPERVLDVLELLQGSLRFIMKLDDERRSEPRTRLLVEQLNITIARVVKIAPALGFAQMGVWALWQHEDVNAILRANLAHLGEWSDETAWIEKQLAP